MTLFSPIQIPRLTEEHFAKCEILIFEDEFICTLKNMLINNSHGKEGLEIELYEAFCDKLKISFIAHFLKRS